MHQFTNIGAGLGDSEASIFESGKLLSSTTNKPLARRSRKPFMYPLDGGFYFVRSPLGFRKAAHHFDYQAKPNQIYGCPSTDYLPAIVAMRSIYDPHRGRLVQAKTITLTRQATLDFVQLLHRLSERKIKRARMHPLGNHVYLVNDAKGFYQAKEVFDWKYPANLVSGAPAIFPAFVSFGYGYAGAVHANSATLAQVMACLELEWPNIPE